MCTKNDIWTGIWRIWEVRAVLQPRRWKKVKTWEFTISTFSYSKLPLSFLMIPLLHLRGKITSILLCLYFDGELSFLLEISTDHSSNYSNSDNNFGSCPCSVLHPIFTHFYICCVFHCCCYEGSFYSVNNSKTPDFPGTYKTQIPEIMGIKLDSHLYYKLT